MLDLRHRFVIGVKRVLYGRCGEPYRFDGQTLRYVPGTRPVRLRYLDSQNWVNRYDALQVVWLDSHLKRGDTAIDVGAHHGVYSILMAAKCGKEGHVVAFEPDPHAREVLARNVALNPGLKPPTIESSACSDQVGSAILFSRRGNSLSSLAKSGVGSSAVYKPEEIAVATLTLDSYISKCGLVPSCVKIDAEGAEIRILKGAKQVLASSADIICELHPYAWEEFGNTLVELKQLAASSGRRLRYLDQDADIGDRVEYGTALLERLS